MALPGAFSWFGLHSPRSLRKARLFAGIAALLACATISFTLHREVGVHNVQGWFACVSNGTMQVGYHSMRSFGPDVLYSTSSWNHDWTLAWRPFHAKQTTSGMLVTPTPGPTLWRFLVVPLWPLVLVGTALAAYAHGKLVALRSTRELSCRTCGYDLTRVREEQGRKRCPECGVLSSAAPSEARSSTQASALTQT